MKLLKNTSFLFIYCFFIPSMLEAIPLQMFSPGDPVMQDLRFLLRETGRSFVSFSPPLSSYEVSLILENIEDQTLSEAGREAYNRIQKRLHPKMRFSERFFSADARVQLALQVRMRSNQDVEWTRGSGGTNPSWTESEIPAFAKIYLNLYLADMLTLNAEPGVSADPTLSGDQSKTIAYNVPGAFDYTDANSPFRAFGAAGGPWWNLQIGRDKVSFGSGNTGNLLVSDNPDYYDFVRLSFFSENFKYTFFVSQLPLSDGVNSKHQLYPEGFAVPDHDIHETTDRYFFLHRTDFRLFKVLSVNLSEGLMAGTDGLSLRYLNPFMIYHSFYSWNDYPRWRTDNAQVKSTMTGSILAAELEWAIIPSLSFYSQFVMNEAAFTNELKEPDTIAPNAMGYLAGFEYVASIKPWIVHCYLEGVYTDPYLYMLSSPFASFISMRRLAQSVKPEYGHNNAYTNEQLRYQWIGYAEGRDVLLIASGVNFYKKNLNFSSELSFARKGRHGIYWDWQQGQAGFEEKTPAGTAVNRILFSLEANWQVTHFLSLGAYGALTLLWNADREKGRFETGSELSISAVFKY